MISKTPVFSIIFALLLSSSAILISFSTLLTPFALRAWPVVFAGGGLGLLFSRLQRGGELRLSQLPELAALLALLGAGFTQALAANSLPSGLLPLHALPGQGVFFLLVGYAAAFSLTWLYLRNERWASGSAALAAAGLFSSTIFFRISAVPEVGEAHIVLAGFALLALSSTQEISTHLIKTYAAYWKWTTAFILALVTAAIVSPTPYQSIVYVAYIVVVIGLTGLASVYLSSLVDLKQAAWFILVLGAGLPVLLAVIKAVTVACDLGLAAALAYRLHPSEMGGANYIARSVLITAPLGAALLFFRHRGRWNWPVRTALFIIQVLILVVILYARSYEGFFAWLAAFVVFGILSGWRVVRKYCSWAASSSILRLGHIAAGVILLSAILYSGFRVGYSVNPYSFNGRFAHWVGAIKAWQHHPFFGGGPGNEYLYTRYAGDLTIVGEAQEFIDDPLYVIRYRAGLLKAHAHNLFLEIAAFSGLAGLIPFIGMLVALMLTGIKTWKQANPEHKLLAGACLAGVSGELAWGLLDVIRETPPFYSFPVWAILGLLLAICARSQPQENTNHQVQLNLGNPWGSGLILAGLFFVIFLPSISTNRYSSGFHAFQEHRWEDSVRYLREAVMINPLEAHYYWLLSKAELELGQWDRAETSLRRAISLKQGYSPYLAQAGWLAWLKGDLGAAKEYFEESIVSDPYESWTSGLYANLGLLGVYEGQHAESYRYFARSLEYHPELATAPYWVTTLQSNGELQVGIARAYYPDEKGSSLNTQMFAHLGMANISTRHFKQNLEPASTITLERVLDTMHEAYLAAKSEGDPNAHLILAAEAEAARLAGYYKQAEHAYVEYQSLRPKSAFGYRDLALLYQDQGRLSMAQAMLEKSLSISPEDISSHIQLVNLQVEQGDVQRAADNLQRIYDLAVRDAFHFRLFDVNLLLTQTRVSQAVGDLDGVQQAQTWIKYIRGLADDYLMLAGNERGEQALENCWSAYNVLVNQWVRGYDSRLWQIAQCISASSKSEEEIAKRLDTYHTPYSNHILAGHIALQRNDIESAKNEYRAAAELSPGEGAPYYFLGDAHQALGETDLAEQQYKYAADVNPLESLPLLSLGKMYVANGDPEAGLRALQEAVARTPGWSEAHLTLGNLYLMMGQKSQAGHHFESVRQIERDFNSGEFYDFAAYLADATISPSIQEGFIKGDLFEINGEQKRTIFMHPTSWVRYTTELPDLETDEILELSFSLGLSPESWKQAGDGVTFSVVLESPSGEKVTFSKYLDPKSNPEDRRWHTYTLNLDQYAGQTVTITFATDDGPDQNNHYDWAGWGAPVLLRSKKAN